MKSFLIASICLLCGVQSSFAQVGRPLAVTVFNENFETDHGWLTFNEIVSACYAD